MRSKNSNWRAPLSGWIKPSENQRRAPLVVLRCGLLLLLLLPSIAFADEPQKNVLRFFADDTRRPAIVLINQAIPVSLIVLQARSELFQTILPLLGSVRNEKGCLSSRFYLDAGDNDSSILIEEWETQADWDNHLRSNDCAILMGAVGVLCTPLNVEFKLLKYVAGIEAVTSARAA